MFALNPTLDATSASLSDQDLLERARQGELEAFCDLCRLYEKRLLRQAMTLCGNAAAAEELAQDTLAEAWKCLRRYNGRCQWFTWLCAILLNRHRNSLRARSISFSFFESGARRELRDQLAGQTDGAPLPDQAAEAGEQAAIVRACIESLPRKHYEVIYLRFFVDQSLQGIAAALGCSVGTVKSRLFHALEKLRVMNALAAEFSDGKDKKANL